jgi:uncharacterized protein YjbI with pentapeptide repeats
MVHDVKETPYAGHVASNRAFSQLSHEERFMVARFRGARFMVARFMGARFKGARFKGARFKGASFLSRQDSELMC